MIWVEWTEPFGPNNEPVYLRVSRETAIVVARATALTTETHVYESDEKALEEFIIARWATIREEPND